jgi:GNAT superfamily N-acetyltransferase
MAASSDSLVFVTTTPDDSRAEPLIDELSREYDARYEPNDGVPSSFELRRYPSALFTETEGGTFVLLLEDGVAIAGGAFIRVTESTAEIKRVWTSSRHRRRGLGRLVMAELERVAAARGYNHVELTTGARQPEAVGLYLALGYEPQFDLDGDLEAISYLRFTKGLTVS